MGAGSALREAWSRVRGLEAAGSTQRKTNTTDAGPLAFLTPFVGTTTRPPASLRATPANLRRFAETPVARRAINSIKDRIAVLQWDIVAAPNASADECDQLPALRSAFAAPNASDSFRTLIEQVLEDILVLGNGALEVEVDAGADALVRLYPVDASTIEVNVAWTGDAADPRYEQRTGRRGTAALTPLLDRELMFS